jgi:hypothetical protein
MRYAVTSTSVRRPGYWSGRALFCLLSVLAAGAVGAWAPDAAAKTIYSYIDEQGHPMFTDNPDAIPARYRGKVRTIQQPAVEEAPVSISQAMQRRLRAQIRDVRAILPAFNNSIYGLTPRQSDYLTYGGVLGVLLLVVMYMGKSPFTRLLGFALLLLTGIALPVLMYISDDGPADRMQKAATTAGQAQQERLQQVSH